MTLYLHYFDEEIVSRALEVINKRQAEEARLKQIEAEEAAEKEERFHIYIKRVRNRNKLYEKLRKLGRVR